MRYGQRKLVSKHPTGWELHDITDACTQQNDLAAKNPDRVREMSAAYDAWAARVGARPWSLNPGAGKKKAGTGTKQ
ncbi:MAG: Arylsulfatase [Verrucomicrobiota bacterium]